MAVTATPYGQYVLGLGNGNSVNYTADTIKVALTTSSYTPNMGADDFFNDITNEITGTGYTAGGATLASVTWTYNTGTKVATLGAADVTWTNATLTARYAVVYKSTGTSSTSRLIGLVDFGANQSPAAVDFKLSWTGGAVLTLTIP
jgi:hypothetical protein